MISPPPSDQQGHRTAPVLPERNPSLVQRIAGLFARAQPNTGPQENDQEGTSTGLQTIGVMQQYWNQQFKVDTQRKAIYRDIEEIDNASEEASVALDIIANNVCTSEDGAQMSFVVKAEDESVQKLFDKAVQICKLHQKIQPWVRNIVKYGDSFSEPVVNLNGEISGLKHLPPSTMFRNETLTGDLLTGKPNYKNGKVNNEPGECAFEQKSDGTGDLIATFWPWQIIHIRLNHDGFSQYGKSHLRVSRTTYKKLKAIEESLIVGRLTREYLKLIFYVDTTGLAPSQKKVAVTEFQKNISQRITVDGQRESPFSVMTDFFISTGWIKIGSQVQPSQSKVEALDPKNVGIHEITDVEYLHRKFIATLRVPPAHLGFEKDINAKATLTLQDTQFIRFLRSIQQIVGQGLEQFFDLVLILNNIDPETTNYEVTWPELSATDQMNDAQSELWRSQSDQLNKEMGVIDAQYIQEHRYGMSPDLIAEVNKRVEAEKAKELAEEQQQGEIEQDRQMELLKAKGSAGGFQKADKKKKVGAKAGSNGS